MVPIPVGTRFIATVARSVELTFTCAKCQFTTPVVVSAVSVGHGLNPLFLDREGAKKEAMNWAETSLEGEARKTLSRVPCPSCHAEGPGVPELRSEAVELLVAGATMGLLVGGGLGWIASNMFKSDAALWLVPLLLMPAGIGFGLSLRNGKIANELKRAKEAVEFGARLKRDETARPGPTEAPPSRACKGCGHALPARAEFCPSCLSAVA